MGAHYLIDQYATPTSTAAIHDVRYPTDGETVTTGHFIIRVPDGVSVKRPIDLTDLITKKYDGLLAANAGYAYIDFDDLLDTSGLDLIATTKVTLGDRNQIALFPAGVLQSNTVALAGAAPSQAIITWEVYQVSDTAPSTDRMVRTYAELPTTSTYSTVQVSFDNGLTFLPATDGGLLNIPLISQGTDFIFQITNAHASLRVRVGSWAIVY